MTQRPFDFAIIGSSPLAHLLAGLLAGEHNRRVCLLADGPSRLRVASGLDLSAGPMTRPESWAMLARLIPETRKILARMGGGAAFERAAPILCAQSSEGRMRLAHMRHLACGYGFEVERLADVSILPGYAAYKMSEAILLRRQEFEESAGHWHKRNNVHRLPYGDCRVSMQGSGACAIRHGADDYEAAHTILADDAAILSHSDVSGYDAVLQLTRKTIVTTEPVPPLTSRIVMLVDRGVTLMEGESGTKTMLIDGPFKAGLGAAAAAFRGHPVVRQAGLSRISALESRDGAAMIGAPDSSRPIILAGLGPTGAFLAPALARYLSGSASVEERHYFTARRPDGPRTGISEATSASMQAGAA